TTLRRTGRAGGGAGSRDLVADAHGGRGSLRHVDGPGGGLSRSERGASRRRPEERPGVARPCAENAARPVAGIGRAGSGQPRDVDAAGPVSRPTGGGRTRPAERSLAGAGGALF